MSGSGSAGARSRAPIPHPTAFSGSWSTSRSWVRLDLALGLATSGGPAPLVALSAAAARTQHLKLGTNVLVAPARNPVLLAKELATVDALSEGRLLPAFGLGIDREPEAGVIGVPRGERAARTEEAIEIVRLLWPGEPVAFEGRFTSFEDISLSPQPTRPALDIWLGGSSPAALRRTGRIADGWLGAFVSPPELADCVGQIVEAAAAAGRHLISNFQPRISYRR